MSQAQGSSSDFLHKEYPRRFPRNSFWRQIKRTVNGRPVPERDIELIVRQIKRQLALDKDDCLLDLGCGNGALASRLFDSLDGYLGVDFSEYLLGVADEYFTCSKQVRWHHDDIRNVADYAPIFSMANKVLIYGCISYLDQKAVTKLLRDIKHYFPLVERVFVGNVPNRDRAARFFAIREIEAYELDNPATPIGVWWRPEDWVVLANKVGFECKIVHMPKGFYGTNYRFDIVLDRR